MALSEALPSSVPNNLTEAELSGGGVSEGASPLYLMAALFVQAYIRLIILIWLIDNERVLGMTNSKLIAVALELVDRLQKLNQRSLDAIK